MLDFVLKMDPLENYAPPSGIYWKGTTIQFIELAIALHKGGYITSVNGPLTLKEFMKQFATVFHVDLGAWEVMLNKAMLRKNPTKFIDMLKYTILDYCNNTLNNTKPLT